MSKDANEFRIDKKILYLIFAENEINAVRYQ